MDAFDPVTHSAVVHILRATAVMPSADQHRAAGVLRANLRAQLAAEGIAHWDSLEVTGPSESTDLRGRTWFRFEAAVKTRF
jgi:hypothetical protein